MKTKIEIFCDSSSIVVNNKNLSKLVSIVNYTKKPIKINFTLIEECNNNKAELINVVNALYLSKSINYNIKKNHPIIIYSDSRYAIDTMNQFFAYVKKMRGIPTLYDFFLLNGYCEYQKNYKYFSYKKARNRIISCGKNPNTIIKALMKLMNTNYIEFKWIPREKNEMADKLSKIR